MLVIGRKKHERILIYTTDGRVTIIVADIQNGYCKIGIKAPLAVKIERETKKGNAAVSEFRPRGFERPVVD